jgi:hypothetical protein
MIYFETMAPAGGLFSPSKIRENRNQISHGPRVDIELSPGAGFLRPELTLRLSGSVHQIKRLT